MTPRPDVKRSVRSSRSMRMDSRLQNPIRSSTDRRYIYPDEVGYAPSTVGAAMSSGKAMILETQPKWLRSEMSCTFGQADNLQDSKTASLCPGGRMVSRRSIPKAAKHCGAIKARIKGLRILYSRTQARSFLRIEMS